MLAPTVAASTVANSPADSTTHRLTVTPPAGCTCLLVGACVDHTGAGLPAFLHPEFNGVRVNPVRGARMCP